MSSLSSFLSRNTYQVILHISVMILGILVIVLARQNIGLKARTFVDEKQLAAGDTFFLEGVKAIDSSRVESASSRILIFVFSTRCQFCIKSLPSWQKLAGEAMAAGVPVLGVSIDSVDLTRKFKLDNKIVFPVVNPLDPSAFRRTNHLNGVPVSLIRTQENRVEKIWVGVVTPESLGEMERAISESKNNNPREAL